MAEHAIVENVLVVFAFLLLPVKDWAPPSEHCKSFGVVCLKGGHGQCLGRYQNHNTQ